MKDKMYKITTVGSNGIERFFEYVYGKNTKDALSKCEASGNLKIYNIRKNTKNFNRILINNPECFYGVNF